MNQLTFVEKINVLFKLLFSSPVIIGIFAFSMILMILLFFYSKLNKKILKFIFIIIYVAIIGFAVFKYGSYFLTSIDSFVTLFMANIYFPIIPVYVIIMLISFVIMIVTLSSKNNHKIVKIINTVFFTFIQMLFALFIYVVESSNIDLSENANLYSNEQTMTLLELGMGLFVIWLLVLIIIFYLKKADKIFKFKKVDDSDDFDEYINDYNVPSKSSVKEATPQKPIINSNMSSTETMQNLVPEINNFADNNKVSVTTDFVKVNNLDSNFNSVPNSSIALSTNNNSGVVSGFENPVSNSNLNNSSSDNVKNSSFNSANNSSFNIFNNFEFLDVPKTNVERKNDDIEIIDFD